MSTQFEDFSQSFLEEANEHLESINRHLLVLEKTLQSPSTLESTLSRTSSLNELFRSFHTIKGLSGMVGLNSAAELSHSVESVLRAIQNTQVEITQDVIDLLIKATKTLATLVNGIRSQAANPSEYNQEIDALSQLLPEKEANSPALTSDNTIKPKSENQVSPDQLSVEIPPDIIDSLQEVDYQKIQLALNLGRYLSFAYYVPSADKSPQDENVNIIRQKLRELGEILKALPIINNSKVRFVFLIATEVPIDYSRFPEVQWAPLKTKPADQTKQKQTLHATQRETELTISELPITIRVDLQRLDEIMRLASELIVRGSRLEDSLKRIPAIPSDVNEILDQTIHQMNRNLRDLNRAVLRARMVPLSDVFNAMPLAVRDLARASGKDVRLVMEGKNTEIDRLLVERLLEPLLHLMRNAITHGIETTGERSNRGKPQQGTIWITGKPEGDQVLVSVADDGQGVNIEKVRANAMQRGWIKGDQTLSNADILDLICRPGLSTQSNVDLSAGRGVGMSIVHKMVTSLGGNLTLYTVTGKGTTFTLRFPMTLTVMNAILVRCGSESYAIPQNTVSKVIEINPAYIASLEGGELYPYLGDSITLIRLADLFHLPSQKTDKSLYGLITGEEDRTTCLVVDKLIGIHEIVVQPIHDPLIAKPGVLGAAELGNGQVILIIDTASLLSFISHSDHFQISEANPGSQESLSC